MAQPLDYELCMPVTAVHVSRVIRTCHEWPEHSCLPCSAMRCNKPSVTDGSCCAMCHARDARARPVVAAAVECMRGWWWTHALVRLLSDEQERHAGHGHHNSQRYNSVFSSPAQINLGPPVQLSNVAMCVTCASVGYK